MTPTSTPAPAPSTSSGATSTTPADYRGIYGATHAGPIFATGTDRVIRPADLHRHLGRERVTQFDMAAHYDDDETTT